MFLTTQFQVLNASKRTESDGIPEERCIISQFSLKYSLLWSQALSSGFLRCSITTGVLDPVPNSHEKSKQESHAIAFEVSKTHRCTS